MHTVRLLFTALLRRTTWKVQKSMNPYAIVRHQTAVSGTYCLQDDWMKQRRKNNLVAIVAAHEWSIFEVIGRNDFPQLGVVIDSYFWDDHRQRNTDISFFHLVEHFLPSSFPLIFRFFACAYTCLTSLNQSLTFLRFFKVLRGFT